MTPRKRWTRSRRLALLGVLAVFLGLHDSALGATRTVHVGRGGNAFVDDTSGSNISTIQVGDTVTWVWEGAMEHSVTSGTCTSGGGGVYVYGGDKRSHFRTPVEFAWGKLRVEPVDRSREED